jgi:phage baseplate assembly protein W
MTSDADEVLRSTERDRLRSLVEADMEVAGRLHAEDYQLITPTGAPLTRAEYLGGIASGQMRYQVFEPISEIAVRQTEAAAVLRYRARIRIEEGDGHADLTCWHTDYYELQAGRWQAVWSQATMITPRS